MELLPVDPERSPLPLPGAPILPFRTPLDRLVNCGSTKADFGWKIVRMFIDAKLDLPIAIHDQALVRANWFLRTDCPDGYLTKPQLGHCWPSTCDTNKGPVVIELPRKSAPRGHPQFTSLDNAAWR